MSGSTGAANRNYDRMAGAPNKRLLVLRGTARPVDFLPRPLHNPSTVTVRHFLCVCVAICPDILAFRSVCRVLLAFHQGSGEAITEERNGDEAKRFGSLVRRTSAAGQFSLLLSLPRIRNAAWMVKNSTEWKVP